MEFYRMFNKNFLDNDLISNLRENMDTNFNLKDFESKILVQK